MSYMYKNYKSIKKTCLIYDRYKEKNSIYFYIYVRKVEVQYTIKKIYIWGLCMWSIYCSYLKLTDLIKRLKQLHQPFKSLEFV